MVPRGPLHPALEPAERKRLFLLGIEQFNAGSFFASHESWEEIWRSTRPHPRDLFQGLIQVAAGMHHFAARGNAAVARRVLAKGRRRIEPYAPDTRGLDVAGLIGQVLRWEGWLAEPQGEPPPLPAIRVVDPAQVA